MIVVGGGLAGLAAATYLARAGRSVTLFEQAAVVGGRARTRKQGAFSLNQGAHAFYLGGPAEQVLHELGVPYSGHEPLFSTIAGIEEGNLSILPTTLRSMLSTRALRPSDKLELIRVLGSMQRLNPRAFQGMSWQDWLERHVHTPRVRQLLSVVARLNTYAHAPAILDAGLAIKLLKENPKVYYLDDGWQTLVDGLRQAAQQAGGKIVTGARVEAIEQDGIALKVCLKGGEMCSASTVLVATDPVSTSALVDGGKHAVLCRWAAEAVPAQVACLDIALRRLPDPQHLFALGIDRPLYLSVHSAFAHLAPGGSALIHTMKYFSPGEPRESKADERELEALLDLVQPGWRSEVVERQFLPHMFASHAIVQAQQGGMCGRPGPAVPGIRNLYVAGDWVGPEGQLSEASLASARLASHLILTTEASQQEYSYSAASQV
jgi:phytoene dehydrogenase-like protein